MKFQNLVLVLIILASAKFSFSASCDDLFKGISSTCPAWQCGTNIFRLVEAYTKNQIDLKHFDVVFVAGAKRSFAGLPPAITQFEVQTRHGQMYFKVHFFLMENATGKIFDPDFQSEPVMLREYAQKMYGSDNLDALQVKRLGAHQYYDLVRSLRAENQSDMMPVVKHIEGPTPQWPMTSFSEILKGF